MNRIAVELDAKLHSLDPASAEALTRKVREAIVSVEAAEHSQCQIVFMAHPLWRSVIAR